MSTTLENPKFVSQLQTKLPTKSEAGFFRAMLCSGACFLASLAVLVIQQLMIARTFSAHLEAGGIDDPDAVFGHFNPLILLAPFAVVICALGLVVCSAGWLVRKCQRHRRMRYQLQQWQNR
jgi:hypothetical protein